LPSGTIPWYSERRASVQVTTEKNGNRLVIRASGRFDAAGAKIVAGALEQALTSGSHTVELDMGGVDYLSSAGIRVLVSYYQRFQKLGGSLYLTSVGDRICRLLEMTGLYELLESPEQDAGAPGQERTMPGGWSLAARVLEADGCLVLRIMGRSVPEREMPAGTSPEVLAFPPGTLAFGTGAPGYEAAECLGRFGPFLAAGGYAAFHPPGSGPDFEEYAEEFIPKLYVRKGIALSGNYARQFTFESNASPPDPGELAGAFPDAFGVPAAGFVIAAECELPKTFRSGRTAPEPGGVTSADGSRLCLVLIAGIAGMPGSLPELTVPAGPAGPVFMAHAAFFPYRPLRRHGNVKLEDTVDLLFDLELLDVVPLMQAGEGTPVLRLLRGLAWSAPVQERPR
jgi:anti-anti-sigma factor